MAVSENDLVVGPLTPAAGVTTISLDFYFEQAAWLEVYKSGSETPLVLGTDYTVAGAGSSSGVVTLTTAANGTDAYSIYLAVPLKRSSDMQLRGEFKSEPFNIEMDRLWQALQGLDTQLSQTLRTGKTSTSVAALETYIAADRANKAIVFSADGGALAIGPTSDQIAAAQGYSESAAASAVLAAQYADGYALGARMQTQRIMQRLKNDDGDCNIVVFSDSTGDAATEWVRLIAGRLASAWPSFTVKYCLWDSALIPETYSATTETVQSGSGANTLTVWNCAVPGSVATHFAGARFTSAATQAQNPDLIILNYGHNGGSDAIQQVGYHNTLLDQCASRLPDVPVILTGQNPWLDGTGNTPAKVNALRALAARRGCGFIDIHAAFLQSGVSLASLMADNVHPNATGQALWADVVERVFVWQGGDASGQTTTGLDSYVIEAVHNFAEFAKWTLSGNAAVAKNTVYYETLGHSTKLSNTVGANGWIYVDLVGSQDVIAYRNKYVTFALRRRVDTAQGGTAGRVEINDGVGSTISSGGGVKSDGFAWHFVTHKMSGAATRVRVYVYASSAATAEELYLDRGILSLGTLPLDSPPMQLQTFMRGAILRVKRRRSCDRAQQCGREYRTRGSVHFDGFRRG